MSNPLQLQRIETKTNITPDLRQEPGHQTPEILQMQHSERINWVNGENVTKGPKKSLLAK